MEPKRRTAMMAVGMTHFVWEKCNRTAAARLGVPESYLKLILFVSRNPGAGQKEMLAAGLLQKEADATDKRRTHLYLTEKGADLSARMKRSFEDRDARITAALTPEKERELISLLAKVRACLEEETVC